MSALNSKTASNSKTVIKTNKTANNSKTVLKTKKKTSINTLLLLPEYKREIFKKYMDKSGMMDIMAKSMIALKSRYEHEINVPDPDAQPTDAVKFIKDTLLAEAPITNEIEEIRALIIAATERLNILLAENELLKAQWEILEPTPTDPTPTENFNASDDSIESLESLTNIPEHISENNFDTFERNTGTEDKVTGNNEEGEKNEALENQDIEQKLPSTKASLKLTTSGEKLGEPGTSNNEASIQDQDEEEEMNEDE